MRLALIAYLVPDYDEAIDWFVKRLGFTLLEDTNLGAGKRWVRVAASPNAETALLLARAVGPEQTAAIGQQTGGRVGWFLDVEDFAATHARLSASDVAFQEPPRLEPYGWVAVFSDPWGNRWDLRGPASNEHA